MDGQTDGQMDGHGEISIPPYNFVAGGIINCFRIEINHNRLIIFEIGKYSLYSAMQKSVYYLLLCINDDCVLLSPLTQG
jgi:hypothetical protein